ncbi:MAG: hypothetical protein R3E13_11365 [Alphaproteobacteria bacterium]
MSEVNAADLRPVESPDDVIHTYEGAGQNAKTGVEVELAFFDPQSPDLATMTPAQNKVVKNATNAQCGGDFARNEPTSEMLEIGSIAGNPDELRHIMKDTQSKIECLSQKAADIGLKRSYFQHLPDKTATQLLANLMDVDRYQAFFGPPREDMKAVAAYFSVCKSNQISVSYRNHNHLLENIRRLYVLAPFLFMITDNAAPFNEGLPFKGNAGMHHRAALGDRGGVPPYVYTAKTGEEYIAAHIDHVMNNPLFVYYDEKGNLIRLPSGTWTSFNKLRDKGLSTATNYYFSESILWPDVKIAALKNDAGEVINHRYEARMFGVGLHQHQTALLIMAALAFDPEFAQKTGELLERYGFNLSNPETLKTPLENAYKTAQEHGGKFLNIPYGNSTMAAFARNFADLIENAALMQGFENELTPLLAICRTGCTDSKVNALLFDTLDKAKNFQRAYNPDMFKNPNLCAHMLFEKEISSHPEAPNACPTT